LEALVELLLFEEVLLEGELLLEEPLLLDELEELFLEELELEDDEEEDDLLIDILIRYGCHHPPAPVGSFQLVKKIAGM